MLKLMLEIIDLLVWTVVIVAEGAVGAICLAAFMDRMSCRYLNWHTVEYEGGPCITCGKPMEPEVESA
jgi:hypothetical protein